MCFLRYWGGCVSLTSSQPSSQPSTWLSTMLAVSGHNLHASARLTPAPRREKKSAGTKTWYTRALITRLPSGVRKPLAAHMAPTAHS
eukprot:CAMPEP_0202918126 /NCGR_PEP_ID=MMETSP1392-20130828/72731_1 /ASSEMBLY_ACC=CAM_ASM_000868 /TAXON_ID=225041 /ORGANISM="Chlamydomonas chlamydogama, Strain SAG 11-48b" /LENGTH=86 /DNA_ID=CAMNT_0049611087 /DNA_START=442 /DNA_END=699 /DNA_ORIENTATION=-